jgi:ABC-type sugar transport system, ATPase component
MGSETFITLKNICKTFPGVKALDGIHLEVKKGEVHALVGENGAGKSTLIKILAGNYQPDEGGEIIIEGKAYSALTPREAIRQGIIVIYQDFSLFPNLTVAENISISGQLEKRGKPVNWKEMKETARNALDILGVDINVEAQLETISMAKQQLVAIARALACKAKLIIMDEPTSTLSGSEVELLFRIMRNLQSQGISILFVSHKLEELFQVSGTFTVIRDGQYIGTYPREEMDNDKLIHLMVGRKVEFVRQGSATIGRKIMEVKNLSKEGNFKDISFELHEGEILGITGLVGAGRTEVAWAICGIAPPDSGEIFVEGKRALIHSMEDAVKYGIGYVPESRLTEGLVLEKAVEDNIAMTVFKQLQGKRHLINGQRKKGLVKEWIERLNIKPGYPDMPVSKLSGGNQQRIVIAKWLATNPKILIIDEPTNGIDIGAKTEIHALLRELAKKGMAIIMISSELAEVLAISDQILVMRRGKINGRMAGSDAGQEVIMNAAILGNAEKTESGEQGGLA